MQTFGPKHTQFTRILGPAVAKEWRRARAALLAASVCVCVRESVCVSSVWVSVRAISICQVANKMP